MVNLEIIKKEILKAKTIAISGHVNPDGDSLGSLLSLGLALKAINKKVYMLSWDGVPQRYSALPGADKIVNNIDKPVDLAISVDCSNKEILGGSFLAFKKAKCIIEIDHHEFRRPFGNIKLIDIDAASVGEMIYLLLEKLNIKITEDIALNLLTSIIVETDSFQLPNVTSKTFKICSELLDKKIDFHKLVNMIFWSQTKESLLLCGICFLRCKFLKKNQLAWSIITKKDFAQTKGKDEDVDAVADQIRSIKDVRIAVLFREKENNHLRVSLRSKGKINVAAIAEKFQGGGHFDVAGCSIPNNRKSVYKLLNMAVKLLK